ncbi:glycosyltransferase family 4 protein [Fibrobacter sp. UWB5]|uniref:glycosyltransferase family 4 protein n=1 Tax=Fibrobacter sp. UWB5 TaxID=1964360 RepID=UPI000B528103|nr:glycosyltransferase family 4 protein [Fibrobacter sp. UWB5]OWV14380.1 hypothetical protein B7989_02685 [Fibrobacter sp. UWB5]
MKVLIWTKNIPLINKGGPNGYCYNIKSYLDEHPCDEIDFYPGSKCCDSVEVSAQTDNSQNKSLKRKIYNFIKKNNFLFFLLTIYALFFKKNHLSDEDKSLLQKYDFVHVHGSYEILSSFLNYKSTKTKVILTTHTPEPLIDEEIERFGMDFLFKIMPCIRNFFLRREIKAYERADLVMFPVAEAREPYANRSFYHKRIFDLIEEKTFYVPTAINHLNEEVRNINLLDKFSIPEKSLKICYIGRHNEIKGYDQLKKIACRTWTKLPNAFFIVGGKEYPLKGLQDSRWIELGWIKTSELLKEIDVFILPNRETYFDIILLEVLRQGVPVVISKTGGNKWFEKKNVAGIHCYDYSDEDGCSRILQEIYTNKINGRISLQKEANIDFFEQNLFMSKYVENYISSLKKFFDYSLQTKS